MPLYTQHSVTDALYGTTGIPSFPASVAPGDGVSLAEVIRYAYDSLEGTTGVGGGTWPAAAEAANGVSIAEALRYISDAIQGAAGIPTFPAAAASGNNVSIAEVIRYIEDILVGTAGIPTFPSAAVPANAVSLAEVIREIFEGNYRAASKSAAAITNGQVLFTITGGSIMIDELISYCATANDGTASTLQYSSTPTLGSAKTISGASASLASQAAGSVVRLNPTALTTAPDITTGANGGVALGANLGNRIIVHAGTLTAVVGVGSTTGTWSHHIRFVPIGRSVTVT